MKKRKRSIHGLGELQAEVMEIVWELGEATVTQVHERIALKRQAIYTTVLVAMQKLDKRGWLTHRREGRANVYTPARSRKVTSGNLLKDVLRQAFEGDPQVLLSSLLEQYPMSDSELADLKKLIDAKRKEQRDVWFLARIPADGVARIVFDVVWQSTVIGALAVAVSRLAIKQPAKRAAVALLACTLCCVVPIASALARTAGLGVFTVTVEAPAQIVDSAEHNSTEDHSTDVVRSVGAIPASETDRTADKVLPIPFMPHTVADGAQSAASPPRNAASAHQPSRLQINGWALAACAWACATLVLLVQFSRNAWAIVRMCTAAETCRESVIVDSSRRAAELLRLAAVPDVLVSDRLTCPAVVSWWATWLIVPRRPKQHDRAHWVNVFTHELAHVQRRDGWARVILEVVTILLPWQPAIWMLRREYLQASEEACDDWVVYSGGDPVDYASALTEWIPRRQPVLAPGISEWPGIVRRRIERLLDDRAPAEPNVSRRWLYGILLAAVAAVFSLSILQSTPALAVRSDAELRRPDGDSLTAREGPVTDPAGLKSIADTIFSDPRLSHWAPARVLGFRLSGSRIVSTSNAAEVVEWNTNDGAAAHRFRIPRLVRGSLNGIAPEVLGKLRLDTMLSAVGDTLVTLKANGKLVVHDLPSDNWKIIAVPGPPATKSVLSGDGKFVALASRNENDSLIRVLELPSGKVTAELARRGANIEPGLDLSALALNHDGTQLATGHSGRIALWDVASAQQLWSQRAHTNGDKKGFVWALRFCRDDASLLSGGAFGQVNLWDVSTGKRTAEFQSNSTVRAVDMTPDGSVVIAAGARETRAWDVAALRMLWSNRVSADDMTEASLAIENTGRVVAASVGHDVRLFDVLSGEDVSPFDASVRSIAVDPQTGLIATGNARGHISTWTASAGNKTARLEQTWEAHHAPVDQIVFHDRDSVLAGVGRDRITLSQSGEVVHVPVNSVGRSSGLDHIRVAFSPDGSELLTHNFRGGINRWNVETGQLAGSFSPKTRLWPNVPPLLTHDGMLVAMVTRDRSPSLWNPDTGERVRTLEFPNVRFGGRPVVVVSPDGTRVASGFLGNGFRIWNLKTESFVDCTGGHAARRLRALAFSPDNAVLASAAEDGRVVFWNCETGEQAHRVQVGPPDGIVRQLAWNTDGQHVFTANGNGTVSAVPMNATDPIVHH